jgi:CO/xanthine dehydrogenase FAD-binding subunit
VIAEYHRPETLEEALKLLARPEVRSVPLAGGSALDRSDGSLAVVDLQALGLDTAEKQGNTLALGATLTLDALLRLPDLPPALEKAARLEAAHNLRQVATVAGTLVAADGRSPFATALLALDPALEISAEGQPAAQLGLGELLYTRPDGLAGKLITRLALPLSARLAYEYVARTPADRPIVCAAAARWPSGRVRVALGGYGPAPALALDGSEPPEADAAAEAAADAYSDAADEWASAAYRQEVAAVLVRRCLAALRAEEA